MTTLRMSLMKPLLLLSFLAGFPGAAQTQRPVVLSDLQAVAASLEYLQARAGEVGIVNADEEFRVRRVFRDQIGQLHVRLDQLHQGIPVYGQQVIVHLDGHGSPRSATGSYWSAISVPIDPRLASWQAAAIAQDHTPGLTTAEPAADLVLFPRHREVVLAYRVALTGEEPPYRVVIFVDAMTGEVVHSFRDLHTLLAVGHSLYSGTVDITTSQARNRCENPDPIFPVVSSELQSPGAQCPFVLLDASRGSLRTVDMRGETDLFSTEKGADFLDDDNIWGDGTATDRTTTAVDAHFAGAMAFDYYRAVHGRQGILDDGRGPLVRMHFDYPDAWWVSTCPNCVNLGDGGDIDQDGVDDFGPMVALDLVAHELTHGVTEAEAGLIYSGESGALNETMSDVFAAAVEFFAADRAAGVTPDYRIGEDVCLRGGALRLMDRPTWGSCYDMAGANGCVSIDTYRLYRSGMDVHCASGIGNNAFYLLAEGGVHRLGKRVTGIGREGAEKIFYRALTAYMTPGETFAQAQEDTLRAAEDLFGPQSPEVASVCQAWRAVGVGGAPCCTCPPPTTCGVHSFDDRFRAVNDYAGQRGYGGGFPNFNQATNDSCLLYGTVLVSAAGGQSRDVPASALGDPQGVEARFRAVHDYAVRQGFVGGFPNFHEADHGLGRIYGTILLKRDAAEWRDVPARILNHPQGVEARFRAVHDYALRHGFVGGFPNFHETDDGQGTVYGVILLRRDAGEWRDVPANGFPCTRSGRPVGVPATTPDDRVTLFCLTS